VLLERHDHHVVLIVEDDGAGFDAQSERQGDGQWGLVGMRERVAMVGGTLEIESTPNKGTTIFVRVPLSGVESEDR
jgi:signal transduction histidine kinase